MVCMDSSVSSHQQQTKETIHTLWILLKPLGSVRKGLSLPEYLNHKDSIMNTLDLALTKLSNQLFIQTTRIGSSTIVANPGDVDELVLTDVHTASIILETLDWTPDASYNYDSTFTSYKKDGFNIILTDSNEFYYTSVAAQRICETLQLTNKADRINIFSICKNIKD